MFQCIIIEIAIFYAGCQCKSHGEDLISGVDAQTSQADFMW